ncbi:hypothetical protein [Butyrivibrio sp. M55]|uniref:hypothetical protein n=1 Tax=Butyrivibrio sp. M55 TaxID=1855323 RepID=UPI0008DF75C5|nr:hypothetical protein [Butyrivibrio sp. M55]SFU89568.1 hypothetical protein SAMN05216540_11837 [Butyrivibrio sp. M55]
MAYKIDGMNVSYDYSELIMELKSDVAEGLLDTSSIINIVRAPGSKLMGVNYIPIVDYYCPNALIELTEPLEILYNRDEYTDKEWEDMEEERRQILKKYRQDEPFFEKATVLAVLTEMEQWNKIL